MKVGDKVDVISASVADTWNKAEFWFSHGWEIDDVHLQDLIEQLEALRVQLAEAPMKNAGS